MEKNAEKTAIEEKLSRLIDAFCPILYEDDEIFLENMKGKNLAGDDIRRYQHWEWTQGVGLYGLWKLFANTKDPKILDILVKFFDRQLAIGFPALNVNTMAPFLAMSYVGEYLDSERYLAPCRESARWIMEHFPRTREGGFQHMTSDTLNDQELWDDTLFMTVLFLANMGRIEGNQAYIDEAQYQFLLHAKYLADDTTGLWYHGWTFHGRHNFARAFWGRGNCWITIAIPEFLQMAPCAPSTPVSSTSVLKLPHGRRWSPSWAISVRTVWFSRYPTAPPWAGTARISTRALRSSPCPMVRRWQCCFSLSACIDLRVGTKRGEYYEHRQTME